MELQTVQGTPKFNNRRSQAAAKTTLTVVKKILTTAVDRMSTTQAAWVLHGVRAYAGELYEKSREELFSSVSRTPGMYDDFKVVEYSSGESLSLAVLRDKYPDDYKSLMGMWASAHPEAWSNAYVPASPRIRLELPPNKPQE